MSFTCINDWEITFVLINAIALNIRIISFTHSIKRKTKWNYDPRNFLSFGTLRVKIPFSLILRNGKTECRHVICLLDELML